jgi:hypothetical protein
MDKSEPGPIITDSRDSGLNHALDAGRLGEQRRRVKWHMLSRLSDVWVTLAELSAVVAAPEASVSARLRDLRKKRYGAYTVEKRRRKAGCATYEYRVL